MPQDNNSDYQDELDVLQAQWVIGKQRGVEVPLGKDELRKLVDAGRIGVVLLNSDEKSILGISDKEALEIDRFEFGALVVNELWNAIKLQPDSAPKKIDVLAEKALKDQIFFMKYGEFPAYMAAKLALGGKHG